MKTLYNTIPKSVKENIRKKFLKKISKEIVKKEKSIDINDLNTDEVVVLYVSYNDNENKTLKIIHIYSKNGTYYLYLRDFKNKIIMINNQNCYLTLKLYVKDNIL
jgi:hypothetical protein